MRTVAFRLAVTDQYNQPRLGHLYEGNAMVGGCKYVGSWA